MSGRQSRALMTVVGMTALILLTTGSPAPAQIAYVPGIGFIPSGQTMTVTPAVSADRRYVRVGVNAFFNALNGFTTFNIPAAVGGGGGFAGMNGPIGQGGLQAGGAGFGGGAGGGGAGFGGPVAALGDGLIAPADDDPLAGGYFAPPEGLIKGDPFSLDAIEQNRKKDSGIPQAGGDPEAEVAVPIADDAFAEPGGPPSARSRNRTVRGSRTAKSKIRATPAQARTPSRVKPKKKPAAGAKTTVRRYRATGDPFANDFQ